MTTPDEILRYWFGDSSNGYTSDNKSLWWKKSAETDAFIRDTFLAAMEQAQRGALDDWRAEARSCLALVILLDQFSRNVYRDTPDAWAHDGKALEVALGAIDAGLDKQLEAVERVFLYMPLMHAEDRAIQRRSVSAFEQLANEVPLEHRKTFADNHRYAVQHADIVDRFGRYPHRNAILGRDTTDEEEAFLKQPGSSF